MEYELDIGDLQHMLGEVVEAHKQGQNRVAMDVGIAIEILERLLAIVQITPVDSNVPQFAVH